jgi:DNA-binding NarL/FixJ family response regulator
MASLIKVLVVDDHPIVAQGTAAVLDATSDLSVIGVCFAAAVAIDDIERLRPDVILSDLMFGVEPLGFEVVKAAAKFGIPVVITSSFEAPHYYATALRLGAAGYVTKNTATDQLIAAVRAAAAGRTSFDLVAIRSAAGSPSEPTKRERQVMELVAEGLTNAEVANRLDLSENTVMSHLRRLFARYGIASRTELAMRARHDGWISR